MARAGLVLVGLTLALVLLEAGLQLASVFFDARAVSIPTAGRSTILTLGDSHTYGLYMEPEDSYPGRLETILDARTPGRYGVVNLGLPGTNSSEIVTRLPGWLNGFTPRVVVLCVGVNNVWNRSDATKAGETSLVSRVLDRFRLVRFWRLLRDRLYARMSDAQAERPRIERRVQTGGVEFRDARTNQPLIRHEGSPFNRRPLTEAIALLRRDLGRIHDLVTERGARLLILTYAEFPAVEPLSWGYNNQASVNVELRRFAAERGVVLIDGASRIGQLLADGTPVSSYFHEDGSHLNAEGYAALGALVADALEPESP